MARKLYPLGIQTFEEIITSNLLYIDKTEYIYRMTHSGGKHYFLARPRRFGKSLLVSTLQSYFEGKKDLFKGLAIEKLEQEWTEYPVLHFDMSGGVFLTKMELERYICCILEEQEKKYGINTLQSSISIRLANLIKRIYEKKGKQVVVLIDAYDKPLLEVNVMSNETLFEEFRILLYDFFSPLKTCDKYLRFVFFTGITRFTNPSSYTSINNVTDISLYPEYSCVCGFTKDELLNQMAEDIEQLSMSLSLSKEETLQAIENRFDGYKFAWPSVEVFDPYSLLYSFFMQKILFDGSSFNIGMPMLLGELIRQNKIIPSQIDNFLAVKHSFAAPIENLNCIIPLLYQSGYITIKGYDNDSKLYELGIPNKDIKVGLYRNILHNYLYDKLARQNTVIAKMAIFIDKQDMDGALQLLQTFLGTIPCCNVTNYEGYYQQMLFIIFSLLTDYLVDVEVHTPKGRVDIVLLTKTDLYIIELKLNKDAQTAMRQINLKNYRLRFALSGKPITKVGVNFDGTTGNIADWVIE